MIFLANLPFPGGRTPVVAVHCSASGPRQWDRYRDRLDPDVTFIAPQLLGYDAAGWPRAAPLTLEAEARHVLASFPREPVHLVGHSYGGAVALQAALLSPDRVRSLTLYEPALFWLLQRDAASAAPAGEIEDVAVRLAQLVAARCHDEAAGMFVDFWSGPGVWGAMDAARRGPIARAMPKVSAEFEAIARSRIRLSSLRRAAFAVRLLCGDRSPAPSRRIAQLVREQVPLAQVLRVRGAGHMAPLIQRDVLAPLLFPHSLLRDQRHAAADPLGLVTRTGAFGALGLHA